MTDAAYEKYRCPVFKGFVVCVSGMASEERNNVRNIVEQNGEKMIGILYILRVLYIGCLHALYCRLFSVCLFLYVFFTCILSELLELQMSVLCECMLFSEVLYMHLILTHLIVALDVARWLSLV